MIEKSVETSQKSVESRARNVEATGKVSELAGDEETQRFGVEMIPCKA